MWLTVRVLISVVVNIYCLSSVGHLPLRGKIDYYPVTTSYINSPQTVYLLTVKPFFLFGNFVSQCGLLFPDKLWIYVVLCFHFVVLFVFFWGVCESGRAAATQQTGLLLCGFHKERLYYCHWFDKRVLLFHLLRAVEKYSRMIIMCFAYLSEWFSCLVDIVLSFRLNVTVAAWEIDI